MTREETIKILAVIRVAYPAFYSKMTPQDAELTVKLWTKMFNAAEYKNVGAAVEEFISTDTSGYPPSIAQIKKLMGRTAVKNELSADDAWALVSKAAEDGYYNAYNEFKKLPLRVQRILGSASKLKTYSLMSDKEFDTIEYKCFVKAYNAELEKDQHEYIMNDFKPLNSGTHGEFEPTSKETIKEIEEAYQRRIENAAEN